MKEISISSIFREAQCRISDNNLIMTRDGELYRIGKVLAINGKEADGIFIDEDICESKAKAEFLRNYIRAGKLKDKTKKNIVSYIKKLEKDIKNTNLCKTTSLQLSIEKYDNNMLEDFKYKPYKYDIERIIEFVVEARIKKISRYSCDLTNKYDVKADGTVHRWYKDTNEYKILYALYTLDDEKIKEILKSYTNDEIKSFEEELKKDIINNDEIHEYVKKDFYDRVNHRNEKDNNEDDTDKSEIIFKKKLLDIILNEDEPPAMYSKEYILNKRKEILKLARENETILNIILENIKLN